MSALLWGNVFMARNVVLGALVLLGFGATTLRADDQVLAELYGRGVHAFYAEKYEDAHEYLSQAIDKGTQDPRCYYFRGLTYALTGRDEEAAADFKKGAEVEATAADQLYNVSRALQRVQGEVRLQIEQHRQSARLAARDLAAKRARARYEQFLKDEQEGLLKPDTAPIAPRPVSPDSGALKDPFGDEAPVPSVASDSAAGATPPDAGPSATPPAVATPPAADPFGAPPSATPATTQPAARDPFGAPATAPAAAPGTAGDKRGALRGLFRALRGTVPTPAIPGVPGGAGDDPFGAPGNDPFGAPPAGNDPFGAPPAGNDPFGAPPAGNDPFGAPPAGNDPFGAPPAGNDQFDAPPADIPPPRGE
jgi:hypothetical protein